MSVSYRKILTRSLLAVTLPFVVTASATAHVVVRPAEVMSASYQTFTVSVPNEEDQLVTGLKLMIPADVHDVTPTVRPGWEVTVQKTDDTAESITWSGGQIPVGFRDDFTFSAHVAAKGGELQWKAYQTYEDGHVVAWDKPRSDEESEDKNSGPYSVTKVNAAETATPAAIAQPTTSPTAKWALALAGTALILSLAAIYLATRKTAQPAKGRANTQQT